MPITWERKYPCDTTVRNLIDNQADRDFCEFQFLNNLELDAEIVYLKISHVFEGRDAFVYEACNLENRDSFIVQKYAIGVDTDDTISDQESSKGVVIDTSSNKGEKDSDNVYDRLYVHLVIKDKEGNLHPFNHCYKQFFNKNLLDLITVDGKINRKFINLTIIRVFFDPDFDNHTSDKGLKLRISVTTPLGQLIDICPTKLRS
jgi:hypothetical protein